MRPGNQVEKRTLETDSNSSRVKYIEVVYASQSDRNRKQASTLIVLSLIPSLESKVDVPLN